MSKTAIFVGLCIWGAAVVFTAQAASGPWEETFDSYPLGSINGLGRWEGWAGNAGAADNVTAERAFSDGQSLRIVPVFYDDIKLAQVPEPTTASLLLRGGLALLRRSRKQA